MPRFTAVFYKTVCNDIGRERRIRQRELHVTAPSQASALFVAKALFCRLENAPDWRTRAGDVRIERQMIPPRAVCTAGR
jgi:hypothetical protein